MMSDTLSIETLLLESGIPLETLRKMNSEQLQKVVEAQVLRITAEMMEAASKSSILEKQ